MSISGIAVSGQTANRFLESAGCPALKQRLSPPPRHSSEADSLGGRVLAGADDQQPSDTVRKQTAHKNHTKGNDPFGIKRIISEIGLRDGFKIKLLTLRFEASRFK